MKKVAAAACAAMFLLAGCGGGDDDKAKENIKSSILKSDADVAAGAKLTDEQAECFSDGIVDEVGVEKLQEYELINEDLEIIEDADPKDMSEDDAKAMAGVMTDCVDLTKLIEEQMASSDTELTEEQQSCISDAIDEDAIEKGLAASFQGKTDNPMEEMTGALMGSVMGDMGGDGSAQ
jgi:hypothetical protein